MVVKKQRTVVTGPSTPAPPMGSRTNSTQALPKSSHKQPVKSTPLKKKEKSKQKPKKSSSWLDTFLILILSLFAFYAYSTCSSPISTLSNPLCRSLSMYKTHIVDPYILPPLHHAYQHAQTSPTFTQVESQILRVKPHAERAIKIASYYSSRVYTTVLLPTWNNHLLPLSKSTWNVAHKAYHRSVHPHLKPHLQKLNPYASQITEYSSLVSSKWNQAYVNAHPYILRTAEQTHLAYHHAAHYGSIIFDYTHRAYIWIHPYLLIASNKLQSGATVAYAKTRPIVVEAWGTYVSPHLSTISEKVIELSGKRDIPTGNGNDNGREANFASYRVVKEEETKASAEEGTVSVTSTPESVVSTTPAVVEAKPPIVTPEEPVVPVASVTSSAAETRTEELASASSVIADRGPPEDVKSSLVEEIKSSVDAVTASQASITPTSSEAAPTEELASASSVIEARIPSSSSSLIEEVKASSMSAAAVPTEEATMEEDVDSFLADLGVEEETAAPTSGNDDHDDLESFLTDLGLDEQDPSASSQQQPESEPEVAPPQQQQEEDPEARAIRIQLKRTEIENRHMLWEDQLIKLVEDSEKDLIDFLDAVRGVASSIVGGKTPEKEWLSVLDARVDLGRLNQIDGLGIPSLLASLEKEGERLLAGVEGWVKREAQAGVSPDEKTRKGKAAKLEQLVKKVKDRFEEKVVEMQGRVHRWYVGVRDIEVQECLQVAEQVKHLAGEAQSDLGMDYAWLENVNYDDWQRYHDLVRTYEHFDLIVRWMQNPEMNPLPPAEGIPAAFNGKLHLIAHEGGVGESSTDTDDTPQVGNEGGDVLVEALDALAQELDLIVLGWEWRAKDVEMRGKEVVFGETETETEVEVEKEQEKVEEEPVKILPISPVPGKEEIEGAKQVPVIGKSKEQVEQAFEVAGGRDEL